MSESLKAGKIQHFRNTNQVHTKHKKEQRKDEHRIQDADDPLAGRKGQRIQERKTKIYKVVIRLFLKPVHCIFFL